MNTEELQAIRERADAATPGPWVYEPQDHSVWEGLDPCRQIAHCQSVPGCGMIHDPRQLRANAIFVADAREDIPALLDEVARLRHDYAVFEELAPPDMPRKDFANRCFDSWNMLAPGAESEVARLRSLMGDLQLAIVNERPYSELFSLTEQALGTDGDS